MPFHFHPQLNIEKALAFDVAQLDLTDLPELPENWLEQLADFDENSAACLAALNKKVGAESNYGKTEDLTESLKIILYRLNGLLDKQIGDVSDDEKQATMFKLSEGLANCTEGFHDRVNALVQGYQFPKTLSQLLTKVREELVRGVANQLTNEVHANNRVFFVANLLGLGVPVPHEQDHYRGALTDQEIKQALQKTFSNNFTPFNLPFLIKDQLGSIFAHLGYGGPMDENSFGYEKGVYEKIQAYTRSIFQDLFPNASKEEENEVPYASEEEEIEAPFQLQDLFQLNDMSCLIAVNWHYLCQNILHALLSPHLSIIKTNSVHEIPIKSLTDCVLFATLFMPQSGCLMGRSLEIMYSEPSDILKNDVVKLKKYLLIFSDKKYFWGYSDEKGEYKQKVLDLSNPTVKTLMDSIKNELEQNKELNLIEPEILGYANKVTTLFAGCTRLMGMEDNFLRPLENSTVIEEIIAITKRFPEYGASLKEHIIEEAFFEDDVDVFLSNIKKHSKGRRNNSKDVDIKTAFQGLMFLLDVLSDKKRMEARNSLAGLKFYSSNFNLLQLFCRIGMPAHQLQQMLDRLDIKTVQQQLLQTNTHSENALMWAADGSPEVLTALLQFFNEHWGKLGTECIQQQLLQTTQNGENVLMLAACQHSEALPKLLKFFEAHWEALGTECIQQQLLQTTQCGTNALKAAVDAPSRFKALSKLLEFFEAHWSELGIECIQQQLSQSSENTLRLAWNHPSALPKLLEFFEAHWEALGTEFIQQQLLQKTQDGRSVLMKFAEWSRCLESLTKLLEFFAAHWEALGTECIQQQLLQKKPVLGGGYGVLRWLANSNSRALEKLLKFFDDHWEKFDDNFLNKCMKGSFNTLVPRAKSSQEIVQAIIKFVVNISIYSNSRLVITSIFRRIEAVDVAIKDEIEQELTDSLPELVFDISELTQAKLVSLGLFALGKDNFCDAFLEMIEKQYSEGYSQECIALLELALDKQSLLGFSFTDHNNKSPSFFKKPVGCQAKLATAFEEYSNAKQFEMQPL